MNYRFYFTDISLLTTGKHIINLHINYNQFHLGLGIKWFIVSVDGLYVFSTTMHSLNQQTTHFGIFRNANQITTIYVHGDVTSDSTSETVVLSLQRGETISVRHVDNDRGAWGSGHSLFSGFLLIPHDSERVPVVIG